MDGRTVEEILMTILRLSVDQGMSRPVRLRIEYTDATDNIEVPFSLVRHAQQPRTAVGPAMTTSSTGTARPVSREPADAEEAIRIALFVAGCRRTGPELLQAVQDAWPGRWADGTVTNTATSLARSGGTLSNHTRDPKDGYGKGYGLSEWDNGTPPTQE